MWVFVNFFFPCSQATSGRTLREALSKALSHRKLSPEMCSIYKPNPKTLLSWDMDSAMLDQDEIIVELHDKMQVIYKINKRTSRK